MRASTVGSSSVVEARLPGQRRALMAASSSVALKLAAKRGKLTAALRLQFRETLIGVILRFLCHLLDLAEVRRVGVGFAVGNIVDPDRSCAIAAQNHVIRPLAIGICHVLYGGFICRLECVADVIVSEAGDFIDGRLYGAVSIDLCTPAESGNRRIELGNVNRVRRRLAGRDVPDLDRIAGAIVQRQATALVAVCVGVIKDARILDPGNVAIVAVEPSVLLDILLLHRIKAAVLLHVLLFDSVDPVRMIGELDLLIIVQVVDVCYVGIDVRDKLIVTVQTAILLGVFRTIVAGRNLLIHIVLVLILNLVEGIVDFPGRDKIIHVEDARLNRLGVAWRGTH